jgi:glutathione S-transferase
MIELIQFPWSPFCMVQRRILEYGGIAFKTVNIPNTDRSLVWKLTRQRYYGVPIIKDGRTVVFETDDNSQVIAKYLDDKFELGLFPQQWAGIDDVLWRYIENEVEGPCFRLSDIYWRERVPKTEQLAYLRHKERKFGRGCLDKWREQQVQLLEELETVLIPFEKSLETRPFLLDETPRFIDFDLFGMLGCFLYSGHYKLPDSHTCLSQWHKRMAAVKLSGKSL